MNYEVLIKTQLNVCDEIRPISYCEFIAFHFLEKRVNIAKSSTESLKHHDDFLFQ